MAKKTRSDLNYIFEWFPTLTIKEIWDRLKPKDRPANLKSLYNWKERAKKDLRLAREETKEF
jgi:hypothetical protein